MHTLIINKQEYQMPCRWEEVPDELFSRLAFLVYDNATFSKLQAIKMLLAEELVAKLSAEHIFLLTEWLMYEPVPLQRLTGFQHEGVKYAMVDFGLQNIRILELAMATYYLRQFMNEKLENLPLLIGTIARPEVSEDMMAAPDWNGDKRVLYNAAHTQRYANALATLPFSAKHLLLDFYVKANQAFHKRYDALFEKGNGDGAEKSQIPYLDLVYAMAKKGYYGNYESCCNTHAHTIFYNLLLDKKEKEKDK